MLASNKSYQLSVAFQLMSTKLSFEDVQLVAKAIIQCASNVLTVRTFHIKFTSDFNYSYRL